MRFIRKAALGSAANLACVFVVQAASIILARELGPAGFGRYRLWVGAATIVSTILMMGIGTANIYLLNHLKISKALVFANSFKAFMVLGPLCASLVLALVWSNPGYFGRAPWFAAALFAAGAGLGICMTFFRQLLVAELEISKVISVELLQAGTLLSFAAILSCLGYLTVSTALILTMLNSGLAVIVLLYFFRGSRGVFCPFDRRLFGLTLKYGLKLSLSHTIYLLSAEFSLIVLRFYRGFDEVGLYSRAAAICGLIMLIPNYICPFLMSQWSAVSGEKRARQVEAAVRVWLVFGTTVALAVALGGRDIIRLLYGSRYLGAQAALALLAPSAAALSLFLIFSNLLNGAGHASVNIWVSTGMFAVLTTSSLLLIPRFGIRGAALGALCASAFGAAAAWLCAISLCSVSAADCLRVCKADWEDMYGALIGLIPGKRNKAALNSVD